MIFKKIAAYFNALNALGFIYGLYNKSKKITNRCIENYLIDKTVWYYANWMSEERTT